MEQSRVGGGGGVKCSYQPKLTQWGALTATESHSLSTAILRAAGRGGVLFPQEETLSAVRGDGQLILDLCSAYFMVKPRRAQCQHLAVQIFISSLEASGSEKRCVPA